MLSFIAKNNYGNFILMFVDHTVYNVFMYMLADFRIRTTGHHYYTLPYSIQLPNKSSSIPFYKNIGISKIILRLFKAATTKTQ